MPTKTFLNLPIEKQQLLLNAAMKEFRLHTLSDASINQIILEASIPRGSFYQYFEGKEDLYFYVLEQNKQQIDNNLRKIIEQEENIWSCFLKIYDFLYQHICKSEQENYYRNVVLTVHHLDDLKIEHRHPFTYTILDKFDNKLAISKETFIDILDMLSILLGKMLLDSLENKDKQEQIRLRYEKILTIIRMGITNVWEELK